MSRFSVEYLSGILLYSKTMDLDQSVHGLSDLDP